MSDFRAYCQTLTDKQVLAVLAKENEARVGTSSRDADYVDAREECYDRGLISLPR